MSALETPPSPRAMQYRGSSLAGVCVAWLVIVACAGYTLWETNRPARAVGDSSATAPAHAPSDALDPALENAARLMLAMQGWFPGDWVLSEAAMLQTEGPRERMVYAIMAADLAGIGVAREELAAISADNGDHRWTARSDADRRVLDILRRLFAEPGPDAADGIGAEEREILARELGWFGRFAPLTRGVAGENLERAEMITQLRLAPLVILAVGAFMLACAAIGLVALVTLITLCLQGRLRSGLGPATGRGGVYAEAFAVFIGIFTLVHAARGVFGESFESLPSSVLIGLSIAMQIAAVGAASSWAMWRIGSWRDVRVDIGLHAGRGVVREVWAGFLTYCTALPMLAVGIMLMFLLLAVQKSLAPDAPMPSHPAQEMLKSSGWLATAQIFILGVIIAPVMEEIAFRGMLYRHVREVTARWGVVSSMIAAALASSLIFAAIHPQSWPAIPALASLATALCISREWRGSLIAPIVAHGLSNAIMLTLGMVLFRG